MMSVSRELNNSVLAAAGFPFGAGGNPCVAGHEINARGHNNLKASASTNVITDMKKPITILNGGRLLDEKHGIQVLHAATPTGRATRQFDVCCMDETLTRITNSHGPSTLFVHANEERSADCSSPIPAEE